MLNSRRLNELNFLILINKRGNRSQYRSRSRLNEHALYEVQFNCDKCLNTALAVD